jgi:hypothetical protein
MFLKARPLRRFVAFAALAVAILIAVLTGAQAFQQSAEQQAQVSTGRADYLLALPLFEPSGEDLGISNSDVLLAMREAGAVNARVAFESYQVPIDGHSGLWMNLSEHDWSANPFPDRYSLVSGRFPAEPGEVAISQGLVSALGEEGSIALAGGTLELDVVGVILDDANRSGPLGLVAPGTWQKAGSSSGSFDVTATRMFYWDSAEPPQRVVEAVAEELRVVLAEPPPLEDLLSEVSAHRALHDPSLYSELAVLILAAPAAVGLIGGWAGTRFIRRIRDTLLAIGIARTALAGIGAILGSALAAGIGGAGAGLLLGLAIRPVLDAFSNRGLGPIYGLELFIPLVVGALVVGASLGTLNIVKRDSDRARVEGGGFVPTFAQVLPGVSLILFFGGVFSAQSSDLNVRFLAPFLFGSAVVILAPLILGFAQHIRADSLPVTLAFRQLSANRRGASWATVGLASILMLSFSTLLVNYSVVATANEEAFSRVPEGQAQLVPPPSVSESDALRIIEGIDEYAGLSDAILLGTATGVLGSNDGAIMIVEGPRDVERLLEVSLSSTEADAMERGALLRFKGPALEEETVRLRAGESVVVPVVRISDKTAKYSTFGALITQQAADELGLSAGQSFWVYTDISDAQRQLLDEAPTALGFDPLWLIMYEPPAVRSEPPVTLFMGFSAGLLGSLLIAYYSSVTTRNLRPTLAALQSVGVRSRWLSTVSLVQVGAVVAAAVVFALIGAVVATLLSTQTWLTNAEFHVPWASLGLLLATVVVGALVSQLVARRRLSYSER